MFGFISRRRQRAAASRTPAEVLDCAIAMIGESGFNAYGTTFDGPGGGCYIAAVAQAGGVRFIDATVGLGFTVTPPDLRPVPAAVLDALNALDAVCAKHGAHAGSRRTPGGRAEGDAMRNYAQSTTTALARLREARATFDPEPASEPARELVGA